MFNVTFKTQSGGDTTIPAVSGTNILTLAQDAGVSIDAPCSGNGTCGKCRVRLVSGEVDFEVNSHISQEDIDNGWRLACCSRIKEDVVLDVPESAGAFMKGIRTTDFSAPRELEAYEKSIAEIFSHGYSRSCKLETHLVELSEPTLDDTTPDNERLIIQLMQMTGAYNVRMCVHALSRLPDALRDSNFKVNCLVRRTRSHLSILDVRPVTDNPPLCGMAIDIGTTTVSAALLNLETGKMLARASAGNAQIKYGADVINRIIQSTKPGGSERLKKAILDETIIPLIKKVSTHAEIDPNRICRIVIASNTTMNHLFAGIPSNSIRMEPYIPVFRELPGLEASEFNLPIHPEASVIFAPNVGSYVGGDITAGTLATMLWDSDDMELLIDLGTNGEIVLGNRDFTLCCACSAGPAFEGGDISCGMRATKGAIDSLSIDEATMEPTLSVIGGEGTEPIGLCGSGIIDTISELFRCGIIDSKGRFVRDGDRITRDEYGASYALHRSEDGDVCINEIDIDNFIKAKGAIFSGIRSMLNSLDMPVEVIEKIYIAGGIGSGINIRKAISIGMLPNIEEEKYHYIGNSSLTGACAMLLSSKAEWKVTEISRAMTYLELSTHPGYMDEFVASCFLPHTDASLFA